MRPIFVFDGDCAFCTTCARFIERRIPSPADVQPWQMLDLDRLGLTEQQGEESVWWVADGQRAAGPAAIAALLRASTRWWWRAGGRVLALRPALAVAWPIYRWVARNRHRMPGGTPACSVRHT